MGNVPWTVDRGPLKNEFYFLRKKRILLHFAGIDDSPDPAHFGI